MSPERVFEKVHTMTEYYDGPRSGIADFNGRAHLYDSEWADLDGDNDDVFKLTPVPADLFLLALEDWAIWRRWETAFHEGRTTIETHPALPEDRKRHEDLRAILATNLVSIGSLGFRAGAEFRAAQDPDWSGRGWGPLEVRWSPI